MDNPTKILAAFVIALSGCATTGVSAPRSQVDSSLTELCPPLSLLSDGDSPTVFRWALTLVDSYNDCAAKHKKLVEATK